MNTRDVLRRRGVRINFAAVLLVIVIVVIAIVLFNCRSSQKDTQQSSQSSSETTRSNSEETKNTNPRKQPDDNTFDDHSGTSKLFKKFKFVGNSSTMVYHVTDGSCPSADKMNPDNIVELKSKNEAMRKGYHSCDICKP